MNPPSTSKSSRITPRNVNLGRGAVKERWWLGGDPVATAFYNAMSAIFPKGEAFFIDSIRPYRKGAPDELVEEINAFIRQEMFHSREHLAFNRQVIDAGYDIGKLEERIDERVREIRTHSQIDCMNSTAASEHMTAILSHELLSNPRHLAPASVEAQRLWRWHAMEEVEHKNVAFDAWLFATRDWSPLRRWLSRSKMMLIVTRNFMVDRTIGILELLRQDGLTGPGIWWRLFWFAMVNPGMVRRTTMPLIGYFMPGFHPNQTDDRDLLATVDIGPVEEGRRETAPV